MHTETCPNLPKSMFEKLWFGVLIWDRFWFQTWHPHDPQICQNGTLGLSDDVGRIGVPNKPKMNQNDSNMGQHDPEINKRDSNINQNGILQKSNRGVGGIGEAIR